MTRPSRLVGAFGRILTLQIILVVFYLSLISALDNHILHDRKDLLHGKIYSDGIEYFDFVVDDHVVAVTVSLASINNDEDECRSQCNTNLELFLQFGAFPTRATYDQHTVASLTERTKMVVEQLHTGRYYLLLSGGLPYNSTRAFVGSRAQLQYSLNITYSVCEEQQYAIGGSSFSKCPLGIASTALEIAPPLPNDASVFPSAYYKPTSSIVGGCVDSMRPTLSYAFQVVDPEWEMTIKLSTTFAAGFRMTVFTNNRNLTKLPRQDNVNSTGLMQSISIPPGAGFRAATTRFRAPPTGRWVVIITGNMTDNSTCAKNGGASFALEPTYSSVNCSQSHAALNNKETVSASPVDIDLCLLETVTLGETRETIQDVEEVLDATFSHDLLTLCNVNASQGFAGLFKAQMDSKLAGSNMVLRVETTTNMKVFQVLARVNAMPTSDLFDYQFRTVDALSVTPATTKFNTSTNESLAMKAFEWQSIMYPKTGVWYMLLVADDLDHDFNATSLALNVTLRTFACPAHEDDECSSHGKCQVTLSAYGRSYSSCQCDYGYAGEQCDSVSVDPTYRGTQIFFTMASNLAILPVLWLCLRRQLYAETILFAATGTFSILYHACDFDVFCALRYRDLHHLDYALSFNMIAILVVHLSGARNQLKAGLLVFYLLTMVILTPVDKSSSSIAWIVLGSACVVQFAMAIAYYIVVGSTRMGLGKTIALRTFFFHSKNFDRRYGITGVVFLAIALTCWFTATSSSYWIIHSLWHVSAMLAAFCLIGVRPNDRYQLVTPDFNLDVLATPPQYRFAVSSVKSVDILEDASDNGGDRRTWR